MSESVEDKVSTKELRLINGCRNDYKWAAKRIMELEEFRRNAFKAHPNIDVDIEHLKGKP